MNEFVIKDEELKDKYDLVVGTPLAANLYSELVEHFIEQKYNIKQEISLNRQKDRKPNEYAEYDAYCERAKLAAKELLGLE